MTASTSSPLGRRLLLAFAVALALGATGCITKPTMSIHSARIAGVSPSGASLSLTMSVRNDNSFDVQVRNVNTDVTIAKRFRLPTVSYAPNVWLPADQTTLVTVPIVIPWNMVPSILATTATSSTIAYQAVGYADVTATRALEIDVNAYQLSEEGTISRLELLTAAQRGLGSPSMQ